MIIRHEVSRTPPRRSMSSILQISSVCQKRRCFFRTVLVQELWQTCFIPQSESFIFQCFSLFHGGDTTSALLSPQGQKPSGETVYLRLSTEPPLSAGWNVTPP